MLGYLPSRKRASELLPSVPVWTALLEGMPMTAMIRNLAKLTTRPLIAWDERWSTVAAERAMLEADASRARRREAIDRVAAAIILQGALDRLRALDYRRN